MKAMLAICGGILALGFVMAQLVAAADTMSVEEYSKSDTYIYTSVTNVRFTATLVRPARLASIVLTYPTAISNDFAFNYVRGNFTNRIVSHSYSNQTLVVCFGSDVLYKTGDNLIFSSSANATGQLTLNWR